MDKNKLLKESKNFCMAPWIHMHVWPNGRAFPCCLSEHTNGKHYGNTNKNTIAELWNSELAKSLRTNMLADKPSSACTRCYELESDAEAYTLRRNLNNKFGEDHFYKVEQTHPDGSHDNPNFTYMDFRFSNICNMKCRTCSPTFSSSWYDDYIKKFGSVSKDIAEQKFIQLKNKPGFLEELWPLLDTVEEVYWAGGEPLVTDVHWDIMNYWIETGRAEHITINYTTNFSQLTYKRQNVLDLWKKFKQVSVAASLDAMGTRGEYIRSGTEWDVIEANRREMIEKCPEIYFEITPTVSMMNVWHLPDFHEDWVEKGLLRPGAVRINNLLDPKYFCMQVLPDDFKREVTEKWQAHIEKISNLEDYDNNINWVTEAQGMIAFLNKQSRTELLKTTFREWDTWDEVRNEKWYDALPELKFLEKYREQ